MTTERSIPHLRDIFGLSIHQKGQDSVAYAHHPVADLDTGKATTGKKSKKSSSKNAQPNGAGELKTLERHLSMKKTIRKKIMRDLQQAFVDDPNEFKVDNNQDRKAELNLEAMRYGDSNKHRARKSDNFLDMLRGDQNTYNNNINSSHLRDATMHQQPYHRQDHCNQTTGGGMEENYPVGQTIGGGEKQSFWSRFGIRNKNKR